MSAVGSFISGIFGLAGQGMQNEYNKEEAEKNRKFQSEEAQIAREFSANEAALQRDWSSQEAERARDWEEEMYEKYNSLSGKIAQAEKAGVNPMLAITGNAVSPMSASSSAPSGAAASAGGSPSGSQASTSTGALLNLIGSILGYQKMDSEIKVNESVANKNNAEAEGVKINNETLHQMNVTEIMSKLSDIEMNDANIELVAAKVLNTNADTEVKGAQLGEVLARINNLDADTEYKKMGVNSLVAQIAKDSKSLEVMDAQIDSLISSSELSDMQKKVLYREYHLKVQEFESGQFLAKARQLAEPDGSENGLERFFYKLFAIIK